MYGLTNPSISSGLKGAVAYAQAEKERIENEKKIAEQKKKKNQLLIAGAIVVIVLYFYSKK